MRISDWSSDVCSSDLRDTIGPAMVTIGAVAIVIDTLVAARLASGFRMLAALLWSRLGAAMALLLLAWAVRAAGSIDPARSFIIWIRVRSEERRVGKESVSTFRSRWAPDH